MPQHADLNPWKSINDSKAVCDDILAAGERLIAALKAEAKTARSRPGEQPPDALTNWKRARARTDTSADRYNTLCKRAHTLVIVAIAGLLWSPARVAAQRTATNLLVQVDPESHLSPSQVWLRFAVSPDGAADFTSQAASLAAWVRALPHARIHLSARIGSVTGPSGAIPAGAIQWRGSVVRATAGAQSATCTNGSFAGGPSQELVAGWERSGTLTCEVTFSLASPRDMPPGSYSATLDLSLQSE